MRVCRGWGRSLAGDLHGLGSSMVVQGPSSTALQQAVEVVAAATAVHGGDAGRGGGAWASQTSHSCWRHWKRETLINIPLTQHWDLLWEHLGTQMQKNNRVLTMQTTILKYENSSNKRNAKEKMTACVSTLNWQKKQQHENNTTAFAMQLNWQEATPAGHATKQDTEDWIHANRNNSYMGMNTCQSMQNDLTVHNTDCIHHTELLLNTNMKQCSLENFCIHWHLSTEEC